MIKLSDAQGALRDFETDARRAMPHCCIDLYTFHPLNPLVVNMAGKMTGIGVKPYDDMWRGLLIPGKNYDKKIAKEQHEWRDKKWEDFKAGGYI